MMITVFGGKSLFEYVVITPRNISSSAIGVIIMTVSISITEVLLFKRLPIFSSYSWMSFGATFLTRFKMESIKSWKL